MVTLTHLLLPTVSQEPVGASSRLIGWLLLTHGKFPAGFRQRFQDSTASGSMGATRIINHRDTEDTEKKTNSRSFLADAFDLSLFLCVLGASVVQILEPCHSVFKSRSNR